ncbi:MAG: FtsW/RodA/SpoVE family cell cycle protein, partial [Rikenellaceae bacterium]
VEMIHPESDYAFAFFVEEYGLILSILMLLLYLWVFFRAMWIYERCRDPFRELLVLSLASLILVQALLHVMVAVNFLPETGQILPLVSRGGSALFCTYMAFMLMLSISVKNEEQPKTKNTAARSRGGRA